MSAIETIALILVALSVVKIVMLLISPKSWYSSSNPLVKLLWSNPLAAGTTALILGAIVLIYLLQELTMVQIFAVVAFASLLFMLALAPYNKQVLEMVAKDTENNGNFLVRHWLSTIIWVGLMIWVVWEIFI